MIHYKILPEHKVVYVKYTGEVNAAQQMSLNEIAKNNSDYQPDFAIVSDIRLQSGLERTAKEIEEQIKSTLSLNIPKRTKHAYVVAALNQVVWKDFFHNSAENSLDMEVEYFLDLEAAIKWASNTDIDSETFNELTQAEV